MRKKMSSIGGLRRMGRRRKRLNVISVTILFAYNRGRGG